MAMRWLVRTTLGIVVSVALASTALAQMGYGGGGTTGSTGTTTYAPKSYGSGAAIGIGVGAAAAVAAGILILRHRHASQGEEATLVGCTDRSNGGAMLVDDNSKATYSLTSLSKDVKSGERVEVAGKKSQDASGKNVFHVQKLVKDDGPCTPQTASVAAGANP
jgi:hypothetical protein